jgi:tetratricopeptide (TPR) repeat protein
MLLATPTALRKPQAQKVEMPKVFNGVASKHGLAGPRTVKDAQDAANVLSALGLHQKAEPLQKVVQNAMDNGDSYIEAYRKKLQRQIRKESDKDVNLMKDVFEFKQRKLGENHPGTFKSHHNYAETLAQAGRHAEAEPLKKKLLELRRRELGAGHVDTLKSMNAYAETLLALSRHAEVEALQKDALDITCQTFGPKHPDTIEALNAYTATLTKLGRRVEAEASAKKLCDIAHRASGAEHRKIAESQEKDYSTLHKLNHGGNIPLMQEFLPFNNIQSFRLQPAFSV